MKQLLWLVLLSSCYKSKLTDQPVDNFLWCETKVAAWGDSHTEGPGALPYTYFLANMLRKDTVTVDRSFAPHRDFYSNDVRVAYNAGISGQTSTQIKERFIKDTAHKSWSTIIAAGGNNSWDTAQISRDVFEMISLLRHKRFMVIGMWVGDWDDRIKGTAYYETVTAWNKSMANRLGNHFFEPTPFFYKYLDGSQADSLSVTRGTMPKHFLIDELHLNTSGYYTLALGIYSQLTNCDPEGLNN
ncbi:MAG: SGNH/GDSL hydrolase family protein [Segetibacter sp.]